jgi:hypothetical protein
MDGLEKECNCCHRHGSNQGYSDVESIVYSLLSSADDQRVLMMSINYSKKYALIVNPILILFFLIFFKILVSVFFPSP